MKANHAQQQALITLLNRIYEDIRAIESDWDLRGENNDFRPRIEYFHDAVRAMTSGDHSGNRLSVEFLAYDISMLRHIQANPMVRPKSKMPLSPKTDVMLPAKVSRDAKPDRAIKQQLAELYTNYSVLFVALLSDAADRNYYSRVEENNTEVAEIATLENAVKSKKDSTIDIEALAEQYIDDPDLLNKILAQFGSAKKKRLPATEAQRKLKEMMQQSDKNIKTVEQAHFTYVTAQLAVYESARDVVKKMAVQGMNIVGQFVESAVAEAARGQRGR